MNGAVVYSQEGCPDVLGHLTIDYIEKIRQCWKKGCLEAYARAKGMINTIQELL